MKSLESLLDELNPIATEGAKVISSSYIQLKNGQKVARWEDPRHPDLRFSVHCAGGRPYVVAVFLDVNKMDGGGWDLPIVAFLDLNYKLERTADSFNLLNEKDQEYILTTYKK